MSGESDRKEHLKQYVLACVRDNVLSWGDFVSPDIIHKLVGTISKDLKSVVVDLGRTGVGALGMRLVEFATKPRGR